VEGRVAAGAGCRVSAVLGDLHRALLRVLERVGAQGEEDFFFEVLFFFPVDPPLFVLSSRSHSHLSREKNQILQQRQKKLLLKKKKTYTIYSILAIVFVILLLVTAFVTVALTYCEWSGS
jgi:hypothetical protein